MNIRKVISAIFVLYCPNVIWSQTTGKIVDTKHQPVEGATIVMQLPDSTYLEAAISAVDGTFRLEPEPEKYQLIVQHLLYQTRRRKPKPDSMLLPKKFWKACAANMRL